MATQLDLDNARAARHELMTGKRVASIQKNGRAVTFTSASLTELNNYIAELESALGVRSRRGRPATFSL